MAKALKIRDITLRDGQQSLFSSRLNQEDLRSLLPYYAAAGFYIVEMWGGATFDSAMRFLGESPWNKLRECAEFLEGKTLLGGLTRGRNLFGYSPYPNYVIERFYKEAVKDGLNVARIYDALNDINNLRDSVAIINHLGAISDVALCYTVDPEYKPEPSHKKKGFFSRLFGSDDTPEPPEKIFTDDYFVKKAKEIEACGAKIFTLKDIGGLIPPSRLYTLMPKLKHAIKLPVDFHTHCSSGNGLASTLTAILKGVDIVDTAIWWFAGGNSAPAIELVWIFCKKLGIEVDVNMEAISSIRKKLREIRKNLSDFDRNRDSLPKEFDEYHDQLPPEIDKEFDRAIQAASDNRESELIEACNRIERFFGFPKPQKPYDNPDLPVGMYGDIITELWKNNSEELLEDTLSVIPMVRRDAGLAPLVSPASRIIGSQAVAIAIDRRHGEIDYTTKDERFVALIKGEYGHTPVEIDPAFREKISGTAEETEYDVSSFNEPANPELPEYGGKKLAENDEEYLLLELMADPAEAFLRKCRENEYRRQKN